MLQAVVSFSKNSEGVALTVLAFLVGIVSYGCAPVMVGTAISTTASFSDDNKRTSYTQLDQMQAIQLGRGMSLEDFHQEMWDYVPDQYSDVLKYQIRDYVRQYSKERKKKGTYNYRQALREFPELDKSYKAIQSRESEYEDLETFWDFESMTYRAMRLRDGASEELVIEELRQSDLFFNRRYEKHQKKLSKENEGS